MNITESNIIKGTEDLFWETLPQLNGMVPKPVLVMSSVFTNAKLEQDQLDAMVKAGCKLHETQYNVLLLEPGQPASWNIIKTALQPKVVMLFNIVPAQLGIASLFRINELNHFDHCYWLPTLSLEQIAANKDLKLHLWNNSLKPLFVNKIHGEIVAQ